MIDNLALGITHALMLLTVFLLLKRPDLDRETPDDAAAHEPVGNRAFGRRDRFRKRSASK